MVTISTVGYGDQYPVTDAGRAWGSVIIIIGVGIFGTFTGYLANLFLAPRKGDRADAPEAPADQVKTSEPAETRPALEEGASLPGAAREDLRALLARSEANIADMRRLLA